MTEKSPPTSPNDCPECGSPIPDDAPGGLCPACVLRGSRTPVEAQPTDAGLPSVEQLAEMFPEFADFEFLGRGGMGAVFRARQPNLDREIALKILLPDLGNDPAFAERFDREAKALAKLNHSNIVTIHESGERDGLYFFVMEFVDGVNLRQAMRAGKFTPEQALAIVPKICDALSAAHEQGILHRDIKPENILLSEKGQVKIVDFGIAQLLDETGADVTLTQSGGIIGSQPYMAPERIEGTPPTDHRADIYSLGVVFYEMLTGELPIGRFPPPSEKSDAPRSIDEIVHRALEKELDRRFQSAAEVKTSVRAMPKAAENPTRKVELKLPDKVADFSPSGCLPLATLTLLLTSVLLTVGGSILGEWGIMFWAVPCFIGAALSGLLGLISGGVLLKNRATTKSARNSKSPKSQQSKTSKISPNLMRWLKILWVFLPACFIGWGASAAFPTAIESSEIPRFAMLTTLFFPVVVCFLWVYFSMRWANIRPPKWTRITCLVLAVVIGSSLLIYERRAGCQTPFGVVEIRKYLGMKFAEPQADGTVQKALAEAAGDRAYYLGLVSRSQVLEAEREGTPLRPEFIQKSGNGQEVFVNFTQKFDRHHGSRRERDFYDLAEAHIESFSARLMMTLPPGSLLWEPILNSGHDHYHLNRNRGRSFDVWAILFFLGLGASLVGIFFGVAASRVGMGVFILAAVTLYFLPYPNPPGGLTWSDPLPPLEPNDPVVEFDLSTPENAARSLAASLINRDFDQIERCFVSDHFNSQKVRRSLNPFLESDFDSTFLRFKLTPIESAPQPRIRIVLFDSKRSSIEPVFQEKFECWKNEAGDWELTIPSE